MPLRHRDLAIRAARSVDPGISNLEARQTWRWAKVHGIPVARYLGKGTNGTNGTTLREELKADNQGVRIPSVVRWLGWAADVKARCNERTIRASSVVFAVLGEANFSRLRRSGLRHLGCRYDVEVYEETRPDALCGHCSGWGHRG